MIRFKEIIDFIENNNKSLNKESLVIVRKGDKFGFIRSYVSQLNVEGYYDYYINGEQVFKDYKHGDVSGFWVDYQGDLLNYSELSDDVKKKVRIDGDYRSVNSNMSFDSLDSMFMTVEKYKKLNTKSISNFKEDSEVVCIAFGNVLGHTVESIELQENLLFDYNDSYGHDTKIQYKYPCVVLILGDEITNAFNSEK